MSSQCPQCTGPVDGGICTVCGLELQAILDAVRNNHRLLTERDAAQANINVTIDGSTIRRKKPLDGRGWDLTGIWTRKHTEFLRFKHPDGICVLSGVEKDDSGRYCFVLLVYTGLKERANRHQLRRVRTEFGVREASEVVGWEGPKHLRALRQIVSNDS